MGAFDDLVPGQQKAASGAFDDLVPKSKPAVLNAEPDTAGFIAQGPGAVVESVGRMLSDMVGQAGGALVGGARAVPKLFQGDTAGAADSVRGGMAAGGEMMTPSRTFFAPTRTFDDALSTGFEHVREGMGQGMEAMETVRGKVAQRIPGAKSLPWDVGPRPEAARSIGEYLFDAPAAVAPLSMLRGAVRARAGRTAPEPIVEAPRGPDPQFVADFEAHRPLLEANGITDISHPSAPAAVDALNARAARRAENRVAPSDMLLNDQQMILDAIQQGERHPAQAPWAGRVAEERPVMIAGERAGEAFEATPGALAGRVEAERPYPDTVGPREGAVAPVERAAVGEAYGPSQYARDVGVPKDWRVRPAAEDAKVGNDRAESGNVPHVTEGDMPELQQKPVVSKVSEPVESAPSAAPVARQVAVRSADAVGEGGVSPPVAVDSPPLPLQKTAPMPATFAKEATDTAPPGKVVGSIGIKTIEQMMDTPAERAHQARLAALRASFDDAGEYVHPVGSRVVTRFSEDPVTVIGHDILEKRNTSSIPGTEEMFDYQIPAYRVRNVAGKEITVGGDEISKTFTRPEMRVTNESHAPNQEIGRGSEPGDRGDVSAERGASAPRGRSIAEANVDERSGAPRREDAAAPTQEAAAQNDARGSGARGAEEARQAGKSEEVNAQGASNDSARPADHPRGDGGEAVTPTRSDERALPGGDGVRESVAGETAGGADVRAEAAGSGRDGVVDGASDIGTLYANPFGKALGWAAGDTAAWSKSLAAVKDTISTLKQKRHPDAGVQVKENWLRAILASSSADVRAKVKQTGSDTARWVVDQFHQEAGSGRAIGETFESSMHAWVNQHLIKLDPTLSKSSASELQQAVTQVTNGNAISPAAKSIKAALADALDYMKKSGVDVGEVKRGYFPREFDKRLVDTRPKAEFVDALAMEYRRQGLDPKDAKASAESLYNVTVFGDHSSIFTGDKGSGPAPFLKGRVFGPEVDKPSHPLNKFLVRDPLVVLPRYLMAVAKRSEIAKRFGDNFSGWEKIAKKIEGEGGAGVMESLRDYVGMAAGLKGSGLSPRAQRASSWMRTWGAFMFLEKATLSSLSEFIVPAVRSGNVMDIGRSLKNTLADLVNTKDAAQRRAFAEDLGLISGHLSDGIMTARWAGGDPISAVESKLATNYFRRIGLTQWTDATQVSAANLSQVFIRRLAIDHAAGGKLTARQLNDLGVPESQHAAFAKFVQSKSGGMPTAADLSGSAMGDLYAKAVRTFTHQSIMMPSATLKPRYMHSPIGAIIGQLQSFNYAFYENVMKRTGRMAKEAVTGADYTMAERAQLLAPIATIPMLWAAAYAIGEGRDALLGDPNARKDDTPGKKILRAVSRGAPIAPIDPIAQYLSSARYRTDAVKFAAGPVIGTISSGADAARDLAFSNSDKTNTAERKAAKAFYDLFLEPTANLALGVTPVSPLSAAATQAAGAGGVREKFVSSLAGPAKPKNERDTGRTSGRTNSR